MKFSKKVLFSILTILMLGVSTDGFGQILKPVKWSFATEKISDTEYNLIYTANIDKGWTVYSQFTEDNGPIPTTFEYEAKEGIDIVGNAIEKGHKKEGYDDLFEVNVIKFLADQPFSISQKVEVKDRSKPISGYLTFMTCNDKTCLPPTDIDFSFDLSAEDKGQGNIDKSSESVEKVAQKIEDAEIIEKEEKRNEQTNKIAQNDQEENIEGAVKDLGHPTIADAVSSEVKDPEPINISVSNISGIEGIEIDESSNNLLEPVKWTIEERKLSEDEYELVFTGTIDEGWTVYSQFTSDDGPVPTEIVYEQQDGIDLLGNPTEVGEKKSGMDPLFGVDVIKFLGGTPFVITQKVKVNDPTKPLIGYLTFMACDDEKCLTPTDVAFTFDWNGQASAMAENFTANITGSDIDQRIPTLFSTYKAPVADCGTEIVEDRGYLWTFIFGFMGGLFALLTPCVFPMIPITVSFFTKDTKRKGWVNGLIYGVSIIVIYVLLGLVITSIFGPEALNRLSTNWIANTLFFIIFVFFAFSFFGFYEITLPSSWSTKSDQMADKGGLLGIFFMAFTLALVSFSCTGPIIGTALVQAASKGEYIGPFLVMFGFSLALALPFGLFAAFPAWLNTLPKSGGWMNSVKVVLGFLELALAFKFLSIADMTNHWGILKYELFMGLWVVIFALMALYLFGVFKFPHDSPVKKLSKTRLAIASLASVMVIYLATGFMKNEKTQNYNALSLMSGLAPPTNYNFFMPPSELDQTIKAQYMSFTKCANNIDCFKDYYEGMDYAKKNNKPVLLDFTGYGCVNCRKTEEHIWVDDKIRSMLNDELVLISLYVDDDTKLDPIYTSAATGSKLRNVGKKWADFQIVNFEQNSQPLYVVVSPDQNVITSPRPYKEGVEDYLAFLECGVNNFENGQSIGTLQSN